MAGWVGAVVAFGSIWVGKKRPYANGPTMSTNAATYETTVATKERLSQVENKMPITPSVRAVTKVTKNAYATWSSSIPPKRKTRLKIGIDRISSKTTNDIDARSLPQMIEKGRMRVTKSRSMVWRSRSLLMAPAVSPGVTNVSRITWKPTRALNNSWP